MNYRLTTTALVAITLARLPANADEGGVGFWLPGQYGSFAAIAPEPGWSVTFLSYYYSGDAGRGRELESGGQVHLGLETDFFGQFIVPAYTPDMEILGGRPSFSLAFFAGWNDVSVDATIGPVSGGASESVGGVGDLFPTAQIFWNNGVHNWMAYVTGAIPVGDYDATRLSNVGIGHAALDLGGAYTYFNPETGWDFSATGGFTYNFENPDTGYRNGIDAHLDLGMSRHVTEQLHLGLNGFAYQQITDDTGQSELLGDFRSSTYGIGPQIGYTFDLGGRPLFTNLRGYWEVGGDNRTEGGSAFLTVNMPF